MSTLVPRTRLYRRDELLRLFEPRSVAVIGASPKKGSFGERVIANMTGFTGPIYPINAKYDSVCGLPSYPSLEALPEVPDCAVLTVPREAVEDYVLSCARAGVGGVIIFASGYAETGKSERMALEANLTRIACETGIRIVGPNCMGIANYAVNAMMSFVTYHRLPRLLPTSIGVASQSGAMSFSLGEAIAQGTSFSHLLSAGNSCDVDVADLVSYLAEDPACKAIVCVFEGMKNPRRLMEAARFAWQVDKPLIVHKVATGEQGAAAAISHTGSLAGSNAAYQAMFASTGAIVAERFEDIIEMASFFAKAPSPQAEGVAVLSPSGGAAIMAADFAEVHGTPLPQPTASASDKLKQRIPDFGSSRNPCDVTAQVVNDPASMAECAEAMLADEPYGALVLAQPQAYETAAARVGVISEIARRHGKMACNVLVSHWLNGPGALETELDERVALFRSMDRCFRTLAAWHKRARSRLQNEGDTAVSRSLPDDAAHSAKALLDASPDAVLGENHAKRLLAAYGISVSREELVQSEEAALRSAEWLGYPVALKVESPDLPHKTEAGVIRLSLCDTQAVLTAYRTIMDNARKAGPDTRINGVLVQQMIPAGLEILIGARDDELFGPLVTVGLGGIFVELLKDTATALAPVNHAQALQMLNSLKGNALLRGFRGSVPVNTELLANVICRVSELIVDQSGRISEIDVNPVICGPDHVIAVDALIIKNHQVA